MDALTIAERVACEDLDSSDRAALSRATGGRAGTTLEIEAFIYFPALPGADAAVEELKHDGYRASVSGKRHNDRFCVTAARTMPGHPLALVALRRQCEAVARARNGEFDGWGASLASAESTLADTLAFARHRLTNYSAYALPFGWPHDRHERLARTIARDPAAEMLEVSAEPTDGWRTDVTSAWHWRAALDTASGQREVGAYVELRVRPKNPLWLDPSLPDYWLRDSTFLSNDVAPLFEMPPELRRPHYHFVFRGNHNGELAQISFGFERTDVAVAACTWTIDRFVRAAYALGRWQGAAALKPELLDHPCLLQQAIMHAVPARLRDRPELAQLRARGRETLCHNFVSTVSLWEDRDAPDVTVLRDYRWVGPGAFGSDVAHLVFQAPDSHNVRANDLPALESRCLEAYLGGLRASGNAVDASAVRWAFAATAGLVFGSRDAPRESTVVRAACARARALGHEAAERVESPKVE